MASNLDPDDPCNAEMVIILCQLSLISTPQIKMAQYLSVFWNRGSLNQRVNLRCVPLIPDDDAKRHKAYTGSGNRCPMSSLRGRSCIPCTGVLVVGGYKLGERGG